MSEEVRYDKLGRRIPVFDRKAVGKKASETIRKKYGDDHFAKIASKGGSAPKRGYFGRLKDENREEELRKLQRKGAETTNKMRAENAEKNEQVEENTTQENR